MRQLWIDCIDCLEGDLAGDQFQKGWKKFEEIHGPVAKATLESLKDISPELGQFVTEFAFGEIYSRPGLDLKTRQMLTIASLVTLGNAPLQLKSHIKGALNVGCTQKEIVEVILQMAVYAGFPAAMKAMYTIKEVFIEQARKPKRTKNT